jgi:hypothetical protein
MAKIRQTAVRSLRLDSSPVSIRDHIIPVFAKAVFDDGH